MIGGEPPATISDIPFSPPAPAKLEPFERLAQTFARLSTRQQDAFFDLHAEGIERWSASRTGRGRKGVRSVA